MDAKYLFYITLVISIIVQIITGIIDIVAFFVKVPTIYSIIKQLLILELVVQIFEGSFYVWKIFMYRKTRIKYCYFYATWHTWLYIKLEIHRIIQPWILNLFYIKTIVYFFSSYCVFLVSHH